MDLGTKSPTTEGLPVAATSDSKEPKINYPSLSLNDKVATDFLAKYDCKLGDEIVVPSVKFKVTSLRQDNYGNSVGLDVLSFGDDEKETPAADDESADEESVLGYKRPDKDSKSPVSSKELED